MSIGIGRDRSWMRPLTPEGSVQTDNPSIKNITGCHPKDSPSFGYNVINAQPGFEYTWERMDPRERTRIRMEGGQIVKQGEPESSVLSHYAEEGLSPQPHRATPLDSTHNNGEVMLVRWPVDKIRAKHERERAKSLTMVRGGAREYMDKTSGAERLYAQGRPIRFRRSDHSLQSEDERGGTVDVWQPDQGIIQEDSSK